MLADGTGNSGRGTGGRNAEAEVTDGAAGTDAGELGGGGNGDELQPPNATTTPNNPIQNRERYATAMIPDLNK